MGCNVVYTHKETGREFTCGEEVVAHEKCSRHYMQERRGRLGKTKQTAAKGEGDEVTFRLTKSAKAEIKKFAKRQKRDAAELYREAVDNLLETLRGARRAS